MATNRRATAKTDPFAEDPEPEEAPWPTEDNTPETDGAPSPSASTRRTPKTKEKNVAENNETNGVTVTLKGGAGFEASWTVLRAATPGEMLDLLEDDVLKDVLDKAAEKGKYYSGLGGAGTTSRPQNNARAPQAATEHPTGKTEKCEHGDMIFKSGTYRNDTKYSKAGDIWRAFDCSEGVCSRKWDNSGK